MILKLPKYLWTLYFFVLFLLIFLLLYPIFLVLLSKKKWYKKAHVLRRWWGKTLMMLTGLHGDVTYDDESINKNKTYIFTPNHFSYFDIVSVNTQMPFFFSFMAKKELASIPMFKMFFRSLDMPVDRRSKEGAKRAYYLANKKLNDGISLLNFPEGGIGPQVPQMRDFKLGPFKMAIDHSIEIVPITLPDNWKRLPCGEFIPAGTPGKMRMHVHRPICTKNLKLGDEVALAEQVYRIIESKFNEMNGL